MSNQQIPLLFLGLATILLLARLFASLASRVGQPPVVGEIIAGILLGPTLLNGTVTSMLFPLELRPVLRALADVGIVLFMFSVGLDLEHRILSRRGRLVTGTVFGSMVVPFILGAGLASLLSQRHTSGHPIAFIVFMGLATSVTALPVLARIIKSNRFVDPSIAVIALATAATVDVLAWTILAAVQAAAGHSGQHWHAALIVPFAATLVFVVRPLFRLILAPGGQRRPAATVWMFTAVVIGALLSGAATEAIGLHFIFGAFLFGAVIPRTETVGVRADITVRTGQITSLLLPVYFVVAGQQVDLTALDLTDLALLGVILAVATVGKIGGTYLGARSQGLASRSASTLGVLMNTRGLTELVILGVGIQLGLLDNALYSLMVVMALVTTAMTGPLLFLHSRRPLKLAGRVHVRSRGQARRERAIADGTDSPTTGRTGR